MNTPGNKFIRSFQKLIPVFALISVSLVSCLPDPLDVTSIPKAPVQLVVSTQIIPDQSLIVLLTKTFGALEGSDSSDPMTLLQEIIVDDATVTVTGPQGTDTLNYLDNGVYGGVVIPFEPGETYYLHIDSKTLGQVSANTIVQPVVEFATVDADLFYNGFNDTLAQITYSFADGPLNDYYMINVQEVEREDVMENLINPRAFTVLLADNEFNGELYDDTFRVFPRDYVPGDTIAVSLSKISAEYYAFMELRMDNRFSFVEFIAEPVNYPSNVVGGRGFFNLYVPDVRFFVLD